ncbi:hypothetical protein B296_00006509 [Ensete ventricosum]|uniref:Uncharacterized protein n=1 Tax=Ensete ventricosum TaxID=4639 RepID=A0A427AAW6_ENSVE|nr:hypothetical protein B296_00006509 [Ensete ventricosum]
MVLSLFPPQREGRAHVRGAWLGSTGRPRCTVRGPPSSAKNVGEKSGSCPVDAVCLRAGAFIVIVTRYPYLNPLSSLLLTIPLHLTMSSVVLAARRAPAGKGCRPCPPYLCQVGRMTADPSMPASSRLPRVESAVLAGQLSGDARTECSATWRRNHRRICSWTAAFAPAEGLPVDEKGLHFVCSCESLIPIQKPRRRKQRRVVGDSRCDWKPTDK